MGGTEIKFEETNLELPRKGLGHSHTVSCFVSVQNNTNT